LSSPAAQHCANVRRTFLNEHGCRLSFSPATCVQPVHDQTPVLGGGRGVVVCGSPGEAANAPTRGVVDGFSIKSWAERFFRVRAHAVFLSQAYYDIFVRNAFGNYRDVLKEMSFNMKMGKWLSFEDNNSVQYALDEDGDEIYPDENYARGERRRESPPCCRTHSCIPPSHRAISLRGHAVIFDRVSYEKHVSTPSYE
jgi:hypothetical protein